MNRLHKIILATLSLVVVVASLVLVNTATGQSEAREWTDQEKADVANYLRILPELAVHDAGYLSIVSQPPFRISQFSIQPPVAAPGEPVTVKWEVTGARSVTLIGITDSDPITERSGALVIYRDEGEYTFTLSATSYSGDIDKRTKNHSARVPQGAWQFDEWEDESINDGSRTAEPTQIPTTTIRKSTTNTTLAQLKALTVAAENCGGYSRSRYNTDYPADTEIARTLNSWQDYLTHETLTASTAEVEHVVALQEAWCSGGRAPGIGVDQDNLLLMRSGWNRSKGGRDPAEWDSDRYQWRGQPGACTYLQIHIAVKAKYGMSVDREERDVVSSYYSGNCLDSTSPPTSTQVSPPVTTTTAVASCMIVGKTESQYEAVHGIGTTLAARLVADEPYRSVADLQRVSGIGDVKANAIWDHFCRRS